MDKRNPVAAVVFAGVAIVTFSLAITYVAGYFWSCETERFSSPGRPESVIRMYKHEWQETLFFPAGKIEELVTGKSVAVTKRPYGGVI